MLNVNSLFLFVKLLLLNNFSAILKLVIKMKNEFYNPMPDTKKDLTLIGCGYEQCPPDFMYGPCVRNFYILHYVVNGKGYYKSNDKVYTLKKGDIFAIFPDEVISYWADKDDPWLFCWIILGGKDAKELYSKVNISHKNIVFHLSNDTFVTSVTRLLEYTSLNKNTPSQMRLISCILECFSAIEDSLLEKLMPPSRKKTYVNLAISFMEYHYTEGINITEIAKYIGLERSYFYRVFKEETGITPEQFLMNLRIERAKNLIQKNLEFKEIPSAIGLKDIYHFSNMFKKITGITPSQYRKLNEKNEFTIY